MSENARRLAGLFGMEAAPAAPVLAPGTVGADSELAAALSRREACAARLAATDRVEDSAQARAAFVAARRQVSGLQIQRAVAGLGTPAVSPPEEPGAGSGSATPALATPYVPPRPRPFEMPPSAPPDAPFGERLRSLEAQIEAVRKEREWEASERARVEERSALTEGLASLGVTGARAAAVIALLGEQKALRRARDGNLVFSVEREGYADEYDVRTGLAEWAKTDAGRAFLPTSDADAAASSQSADGPERAQWPRGMLLAALRGESE